MKAHEGAPFVLAEREPLLRVLSAHKSPSVCACDSHERFEAGTPLKSPNAQCSYLRCKTLKGSFSPLDSDGREVCPTAACLYLAYLGFRVGV